ncbi:chymotrypsin inhibitor SCI-I-like [Haematobia irritans]|uniref:chymotrypsin inhibitor SCI-I-like n=1 Tax=Haematobia irritans TaxID=7368 RepID=UPI003F508942
MKFIFVFLLLAVILIAVEGQCRNNPRRPNCNHARHLGNRGRGCRPAKRWWYDKNSRTCKEMNYRGCGGNDNRFCSKAACEARCRR